MAFLLSTATITVAERLLLILVAVISLLGLLTTDHIIYYFRRYLRPLATPPRGRFLLGFRREHKLTLQILNIWLVGHPANISSWTQGRGRCCASQWLSKVPKRESEGKGRLQSLLTLLCSLLTSHRFSHFPWIALFHFKATVENRNSTMN